MLRIRKAEPNDRQAWEVLWNENCAHFGGVDMEVSVIEELWGRILDARHPMDAWFAIRDGKYSGFAHTILHPHTFTLRSVCYLEDLWVTPSARSLGIATALISHLIHVGNIQGWRRVYWETAIDNVSARRLYDRIAKQRSMVIYEVDINSAV